jgi:Domain of unknown function (DUF4174)
MRIPLACLPLACLVVAALAAPEALAQGDDTVTRPIAAEAEAETARPSLDELLWVARPLVVFADSPNDPRFQQQLRELDERTAELEDRRVVVLTDTDPAADGPLREELRPRGFGIVLLDTDGDVVQRRPTVTTAREILNLIDRTPSWRQETGSRRN